MTDSVVRSDQKKKALPMLGLLSLLLVMQKVAATEYTVGGANGWSVPADGALHYNQWAERNRFKIGDSLCKLRKLFLGIIFFFFVYNHKIMGDLIKGVMVLKG